MLRHSFAGIFCAAASVVLPALSTEAALIGVQFPHGPNSVQLLAAETTGVISQSNFNVITATEKAGLALVDSSGKSSDVSFSISNAPNAWHTNSYANTLADKLVSGKVGSWSGDVTLTFSNVAAGEYDLIVYTINDNLDKGNYTVGSTTYYINQQAGLAFNEANNWIKASNTTNLDASRDLGNYVRFNGITPDANGDIKLLANNPTKNGGTVNALQLQSVPEPTSIGLLMISGAILARRRQR